MESAPIQDCDLLVIGAGPGGYETAAEAARIGMDVVIIEKGLPGGTCLNRGCIPTKCLCHQAEVIATVRAAHGRGVDATLDRLSYAQAVASMQETMATLRQGVEHQLTGVRLIHGDAVMVGDHTVEVSGQGRFRGERVIIATGSTPSMLPIPGVDLCLTSDSFLELTELPETMTVIGGGVIGLEFACIMQAFGTKVTVVEYAPEILPNFDSDLAKRLRQALTRQGIKFHVNSAVQAVRKDEASDSLCVEFLDRKGSLQNVEAQQVLMAVGRRPLLPPGLKENTSVELTQRGAIKVDPENMATTAPGVYAIGDCNGLCMLAHAATAQGLITLGHHMDLSVIPAAVFTDPEAAMVGLTEDACKAQGLNHRIGKAMFAANGKALSMGISSGLVKMIVDPEDGTILGCHILGPHASDLIQEVATVMSTPGDTVKDIAWAIHAHPTLAEVVQAAARQCL